MLTKKGGATIVRRKYTKSVHRKNLLSLKKALPVLISCYSIYNSNYEKLWRLGSNDKGLGYGCGGFQVPDFSCKGGQLGGVGLWIGV